MNGKKMKMKKRLHAVKIRLPLLISAVAMVMGVLSMGVFAAVRTQNMGALQIVQPEPSTSLSYSNRLTVEPVAKEAEEDIVLKMEVSSVEEDIAVTITDENGQPVTGVAFRVKITDENGESTSYEMQDKTGVLSLQPVAAGTYTVELEEEEGYILPAPAVCTVLEKIEYKPIEDIGDKIVDGSQVDVATDDAGYQNNDQAAPPLEDTVEPPVQDPSDNQPSEPEEEKPVVEEEPKYTAKTDDEGHLYFYNGEVSYYYGIFDEDGYLISAYYYPMDSGMVVDTNNPVNFDVFDEDGNPVTDEEGNPLFLLEKVESEQPTAPSGESGWQTIDGKTYYFDKNGDPITGWQVIGGQNYYFDDNGVQQNWLGIDVSQYQGNIDWEKVKDSGIEWVMIRVGYRGYGTARLVEDPHFEKNIRGATAAGLKVGVYFFSQAITTQEAVEEASMVLELVEGYHLSYPIAFDTEYVGNGARADGLTKSQRTSIAVAFCETIKSAGYTPAVYASKYWFYDNLNVGNLNGYKIWLAHYTDQTDYAYRYDMWQYSSKGSVAGINGAVDLNVSFMGY